MNLDILLFDKEKFIPRIRAIRGSNTLAIRNFNSKQIWCLESSETSQTQKSHTGVLGSSDFYFFQFPRPFNSWYTI
jgi:hypothetical protein